MELLIKNAVLILEDRLCENSWIKLKDGVIEDFGKMDALCECEYTVYDAKGAYVSPGFIDSHVHGAGGCDFRDATEEAYLTAVRKHLIGGTTTIVPTFSSASKKCILDNIALFNRMKEKEDTYENIPHLAGLHLEGPYFSQKEKGAQDPNIIRNPDPEEYWEFLDATPYIRKVSAACELPGALELGEELHRRNIIASVGHSDATAEQVIDAVENHGYRCITHFYSGCSYLHRNGPYREGGVVEAGYYLKALPIEVIGDGKHLPPFFLKLIYRLKGPDTISLITDCIRPGGIEYTEGQLAVEDPLNNRTVILENGVAIMPDRKNFAGSISTTSNVVRVMVNSVGIPLYEAVRMAALNPAKMLGLDKETGSIAVGKNADILILDSHLNIVDIFVKGKKINIHDCTDLH